MRLVERGWATVEGMETVLTRERILDLCDWLDSVEEAEELKRKRFEAGNKGRPSW